ncbi:MAG: NAD(P)-dependent oxidoreductase [Chloroflexi bacterium]|nr:NAD(P)-dependent oxidoreductase [Chloroflexota bacterium]
MSEERFLVTGAHGAIGAWVIRNLLREGIPAFLFDQEGSNHRLRMILDAEELSRLETIHGDIVDLPDLEDAIRRFEVTHLIHLAALQLPFVKADPPQGAKVNVVGTVNIFEAAKHTGLKRVVYASSTAVYGEKSEYPDVSLPHDAPLKPHSLYGVFKQANEGTARVYFLDDGISSIGLRPYVVYGPGRDQGMTSTPTKAMLAAALGKPYHITYGGRYNLQYADDVAKIFIRAARAPFEGAGVFNLGGAAVSTQEVIACIETAAPEVKDKLTFDPSPLPFPQAIDNTALRQLLGRLPETPLQQGVAETIDVFKKAIVDGKISLDYTRAIL